MITGVGVDLVSVKRVQQMLDRFGSKFTSRAFSEMEIRDSLRYKNAHAVARHFAKRFAAKEAYVKATGLGFGRGISMKSVSVYNDALGKPRIAVSGDVEQNIELSLSDDGEYAIAFVVLHSRSPVNPVTQV
ncbi:holo-[acyl-carrier-protein] synthase [Anaplasma capra]|uniref:holo-[acyl-carrier-protein] synthase n=1 Tax=Anaplasma capra TaxID=1562740 RepID=UPI0021D5EF66|nr:holo-[acyl-carrier-protein] synthase [Anaplasma capra]MCU7611491.1 holo-[acyl-carrier-protein] synthase [Anaplasma capra]MCU7612070.1 holo-[acyl-carrier-protein] synthase [Anaplasma capra]